MENNEFVIKQKWEIFSRRWSKTQAATCGLFHFTKSGFSIIIHLQFNEENMTKEINKTIHVYLKKIKKLK